MGSSPEKANLVTKIHVRNGVTIPFADWQAQLNSVVAAWPEFASLEILAPSTASQQQWVIIQSFYNIGNSISVFLVSWPMMPLAIYFLNWWLSPKGCEKRRTNLLGALLVTALYALEVVVLWRLL